LQASGLESSSYSYIEVKVSIREIATLVRDFSKQIGGVLLGECSFVRYNPGLVFEGMAFGN
jgi:hypothetical protein